MAHLDAALALEPDGDGRWRAHADPDHESISSMFGGWTAAVLLHAVVATAAHSRPGATRNRRHRRSTSSGRSRRGAT